MDIAPLVPPIELTARKRRIFAVIAVMLMIAVVEGAARIGGVYLVLPRLAFLFWNDDEAAVRAGYARYLERRDPVLGWPPRDALNSSMYTASGTRPSPAFPDAGEPCVSLFGDSFTYSEGVDHERAWGNQLARRLNCGVANYGVGGYGTDQALLRMRRIGPLGRIAILGIPPENAMRNVNQYRRFLGDGSYTFKPRFVLEGDGSLRLIPLPTLDANGLARLTKDPAAVLPHETFLPGSREGPVPWRMPYTMALFRVLAHPRLIARLSGGTSWGAFLRPDHPSGALQLTVALAAEFDREARQKGVSHTIVVVFTSPSAQFQYESSGSWPQEPLVAALRARGLTTVDLGPHFRTRLSGQSICSLMRYPDVCDGHYNEEGYRWVAEAAVEGVRARLR